MGEENPILPLWRPSGRKSSLKTSRVKIAETQRSPGEERVRRNRDL